MRRGEIESLPFFMLDLETVTHSLSFGDQSDSNKRGKWTFFVTILHTPHAANCEK